MSRKFKNWCRWKKCLESCLENQIEFNNLCYNTIPNDFQPSPNSGSNIYINNNEDFDNQLNDILTKAYSPETGSITIHRDDDIVYQITNSKTELELLKNKSNNIQNMSILDLSKCEAILKEKYNINENDS